MPFHFPLQAIVHLRQSIEHQQELRLRAANLAVSQMQHRIAEAELRQRELREIQSRELGVGLTAAELRFELQCEAELLRYKRELEPQLLRLQRARDQQRDVFQQARRGREMLESVRDHKLREYKLEASRREQRDLDDLFLLRRRYSLLG
jgi:flagellar export protein FliJ